MAVTVQEVKGALGGFTVDCDWSPDAERLLAYYRHLRFWRGEELRDTRIVLSRGAWGADGLSVGGRSLRWLLGAGDIGPTIEDREYTAGSNRVDGPSFEQGLAYWSTQEGSAWSISEDQPHHGSKFAVVSFFPEKDDVLQSKEIPWDVRAGEAYEFNAFFRRRGESNPARLRLQLRFTGRIKHPNFLSGNSWPGKFGREGNPVDPAVSPAPIGIVYEPQHFPESGGYVARINAIPQEQGVFNPDFEHADLWGWKHVDLGPFFHDESGYWFVESTWPIRGSHSLGTTPSAFGWGGGLLQASADPYAQRATPYPVEPGSEWRLEVVVRAVQGTDGEAKLLARLISSDGAHDSWAETPRFDTGDERVTSEEPVVLSTIVRIPEAEDGWHVTGVIPTIEVLNNSVGSLFFDDAVWLRTKGNVAHMDSSPVTLVGGRTYRIAAPVVFDPSPEPGSGSVRYDVRLSRPGYPDVFIEGQSVDDSPPKPGEEPIGPKVPETTFTMPSGYDTAVVSIVAMDLRAPAYVDILQLALRDTDESSVAVEVKTRSNWTEWTIEGAIAVVPSGARRAHVAVIAEEGARDWGVDSVVVRRHGAVQWQAKQVARSLLNNPDTGEPILTPGRIFGDDLLLHDWRISRLHLATCLERLCRTGLLLPARELREVNGVVDFGLPEEIFADRSVDDPAGPRRILLRREVPRLTSSLSTTGSIEDVPTDVTLVGADSISPDGRNDPMVATAFVATTAVDLSGNELRRTRTVSDPSVDSREYVVSFAAYLAELEAPGDPTANLSVSDPDAAWAHPLRAGDWVLVHDPKSDLVDDGNPVFVDGEWIYPLKTQVNAVTTNYGAGRCRITSYDPRTGEEEEVPGVRWSTADSIEVEVGAPPTEFEAGEYAGAGTAAFLRFWASSPRRT